MNLFKILLFFLGMSPFYSFAGPYQFDLKQEMGFIGLGAGMELGGLYIDSKKTKPTSEEISQLDKNDIISIDRFVAGRWNESAATRSDIITLSAVAIPLLLPVLHRSSFWDISLLYAETLLITNGGVTLAKGLSDRYRPYAYRSNAPTDVLYDIDTKRSFFSGHAANISASAIFFAKVYSDMNPESQHKNTVWLASGLVILLGSWQRLESGMHFPTDLAAGIAWGGLVAYTIPQWHLKKHTVQILPFANSNHYGIRFSSIIK